MRHLLHPLPGDAARVPASPAVRHRLSRVLRLAEGTSLTLCDGLGGTQPVRWADAGFAPTGPVMHHPALQPYFHVAAGVLKGERFEWLVEKASELGVDVLTPLLLDHAVVKVTDRADKQAKWQVIADSALEQCGRTWRMTVALPQTLEEWTRGGGGYFADETGGPLWSEVVRQPGAHGWRVALGVEGGWSGRERQLLADRNYAPVSLGPLVLRAETATLAVAAVARAAAMADGTAPTP